MEDLNQDRSSTSAPLVKESEILSFIVGARKFGIWPKDLLEIIEEPEYVLIPNAPHFLKGITTSHGRVITVFDIFGLFKVPGWDQYIPKRIAILNNEDFMVGVLIPLDLEIVVFTGQTKRTDEKVKGSFYRPYEFESDEGSVMIIDLLDAEFIYGFLRDFFNRRSIGNI
jgi:chemotaxis signal transduction protein